MLTSAPTSSHKLAMSFMKLIRVANIEFAAYFIISADGMSVNITLKLFSKNGRYSLLIKSLAFSESIPTTTLSGLIKSLMAAPSFRNSGLLATSKSILAFRLSNSSLMAAFTFWAVPTGTVLLVTTKTYLFILIPIVCATSNTYFKSALPFSSGGVPTAQNTISTSFKQEAKSVEKFNLPSR